MDERIYILAIAFYFLCIIAVETYISYKRVKNDTKVANSKCEAYIELKHYYIRKGYEEEFLEGEVCELENEEM